MVHNDRVRFHLCNTYNGNRIRLMHQLSFSIFSAVIETWQSKLAAERFRKNSDMRFNFNIGHRSPTQTHTHLHALHAKLQNIEIYELNHKHANKRWRVSDDERTKKYLQSFKEFYSLIQKSFFSSSSFRHQCQNEIRFSATKYCKISNNRFSNGNCRNICSNPNNCSIHIWRSICLCVCVCLCGKNHLLDQWSVLFTLPLFAHHKRHLHFP